MTNPLNNKRLSKALSSEARAKGAESFHKDKATPRPWKFLGHDGLLHGKPIYSMTVDKDEATIYVDGFSIADVFIGNKEGKANAELIVRAVNSHDALLDACKFVLQEWNEPESAPECIELLQRAIKQAEAEGK